MCFSVVRIARRRLATRVGIDLTVGGHVGHLLLKESPRGHALVQRVVNVDQVVLLDNLDYENVDEREREQEREEDVLERCDGRVGAIEETQECDRDDGDDQEDELVVESGLDALFDDVLSRLHGENGVFELLRLQT